MKKEILTFIIGMLFGAMLLTCSWCFYQSTQVTEPKIDLSEEFMCVTSDNPNKPDTVLCYQGLYNDSLYIRFKQ